MAKGLTESIYWKQFASYEKLGVIEMKINEVTKYLYYHETLSSRCSAVVTIATCPNPSNVK